MLTPSDLYLECKTLQYPAEYVYAAVRRSSGWLRPRAEAAPPPGVVRAANLGC